MNLLCLSDFNQGDIVAKAGEVRAFPSTVWERLVDSWPGCWTVAPIATVEEVVETEAIDTPPVDKMLHSPHKAKGKRRG